MPEVSIVQEEGTIAVLELRTVSYIFRKNTPLIFFLFFFCLRKNSQKTNMVTLPPYDFDKEISCKHWFSLLCFVIRRYLVRFGFSFVD